MDYNMGESLGENITARNQSNTPEGAQPLGVLP